MAIFGARKAKTGNHVDVFLGPNEESDYVFIVEQVNPDTGLYDEDKVMLGFNSLMAAEKAYLSHYDNPRFLGDIRYMDFADFVDALPKHGEGRKLVLKSNYKKFIVRKPSTLTEKIREIRKGLNKENLQPEQRTHTSKKGTQYQQRHWVKKEPIPTIELEPLTDISKEEIQELTQSKDKQTIDRLKSVLKRKFKENNFITNNSTGNKILITTKGIDKSIIPYTGQARASRLKNTRPSLPN